MESIRIKRDDLGQEISPTDLAAINKFLEVYDLAAKEDLIAQLKDMSDEELDQVIKAGTVEELMSSWIKDPEKINSYREKFHTFSLEALREMLLNIQKHNAEHQQDGLAA